MRMKNFEVKDFVALLVANGWHRSHGGNHVSFAKEGSKRIITIPYHGRTLNPCMAKRLLKEAQIGGY